ncbi:MAG: methylenetetrahydrofolate reductase C-terminal domain-containing protein [Candidatus Latescibacterota bacterium]
MIIAERKPLEEIEQEIEGCRKILIAGCGTCVTVCMAGGEKEVGVLASLLRLRARMQGRDLEIVEATVQRQCDREYVEELGPKAQGCDAILSMACGVGANYSTEVLGTVRVLPALNTRFYGANIAEGMWAERCAGCGQCILAATEGICPIARCSKSLLNGPCGGSQGGKCELGPEIDCAWHLIHERMEKLGRLDRLEEIVPPKDWSRGRDGGPGKVVREDATAITRK